MKCQHSATQQQSSCGVVAALIQCDPCLSASEASFSEWGTIQIQLPLLFYILRIHWHDHVRDTDAAARTGLRPLPDLIVRQRYAIFGHVIQVIRRHTR